MTCIAKVNPDEFEIAAFRVRLPGKGEREISQGEEIFIWTSETAGGRGLFARGIAAHAVTERNQELVLGSLMILPAGIYGKADLEAFREVRDETLVSFLAEKFYYYAHPRVLFVPGILAAELHERFFSYFEEG